MVDNVNQMVDNVNHWLAFVNHFFFKLLLFSLSLLFALFRCHKQSAARVLFALRGAVIDIMSTQGVYVDMQMTVGGQSYVDIEQNVDTNKHAGDCGHTALCRHWQKHVNRQIAMCT